MKVIIPANQRDLVLLALAFHPNPAPKAPPTTRDTWGR